MCVSVSPGVTVRFSDTVLYAAEVSDRTGQTVHALGYQNKVQGQVGRWPLTRGWFARSGNAMILPFPAVPKTMTRANVLDTADCRDILQDVADAVAPRRGTDIWDALTFSLESKPPPVQVFEAAGIYTVVLAQDPRDIPAAMQQVPPSKRPALNPALFDAYARWYPGWTVALCCFNNRRAQLANPLLWWYEPMSPDRLFLPAIDGHTGDVPDLDASVAVDHVIAVGSYRMTGGRRVTYRNQLPRQVSSYLLPSLIGRRFSESLPNGDFVCRLDDVRRGKFDAARSRPAA